MAITVAETNNKLIRFTQQINREYVRGNLFSPYMGEALNSIIRVKNELKSGGEQMNIPFVTKLTGRGKGTGQLVGNEERIDNFGMRLWIDWARNAVATTKAEAHKDSADIFGEAKPLLVDWGQSRQRDDIIEAFMALPSTSEPTGLNSEEGETVNGIKYEDATTTQRNTWNTDNSDRIVYGATTGNFNSVHATALANLDTTNDKFTATNLSLLKRVAENADPALRPFKTRDGYEYFVAFAGSNPFRDLKLSLETINKDARPREGNAVDKNPIFQDGDQIYDGVIIRKVPEISKYVTNTWTSLLTAGATSNRVEPVFLCGQQAVAFGWGQMAKPTFRKEDDYGFITGTGTEMAYGVAKMFKKHPMGGTKLVQWGVATGFYASAVD